MSLIPLRLYGAGSIGKKVNTRTQLARLNIARQYADLYIQTDQLTIQEVQEATLQYLDDQRI